MNITVPILVFFLALNSETSVVAASCSDAQVSSSHIEKIKHHFHREINDHFKLDINALSSAELRRRPYLEGYRNPSIKVYSNPQNKQQAVIYIEYEKDWWGNLYFALFEDEKISKWIKLETHGATVICVRWNENSFFYEDSTHRGTKTQNSCLFEKDAVSCN